MQKQHPEELFNLLTRVIPFLRSPKWATRVAAAKAIGGIVDHAPLFNPNADEEEEEEDVWSKPSSSAPRSVPRSAPSSLPEPTDDQLSLRTLEIGDIVKFGKTLLASGGQQYDYASGSLDPAERLARQKKNLTARLGLGGEYIEESILEERDIVATPQYSSFSASGLSRPTTNPPPHPLNTNLPPSSRHNSIQESPVPKSASSHREPQSAVEEPAGQTAAQRRQLNALKRKNKLNAKQQAGKVRMLDLAGGRSSENGASTPMTPGLPTGQPEVKQEDAGNGTGDLFSISTSHVDDKEKVISDFKGLAIPEKSTIQTEAEEKGLEWPFERLCDILAVDLFDYNWEIRHGAAMGLREVIRAHGAGAGRLHGKSRAVNDKLNHNWLDDLACRYCCVLILDRFGDYVSDSVVAPIRETTGQAIGTWARHASDDLAESLFSKLLLMVSQHSARNSPRVWQVCHGGLTGMKYLVAVRRDLLPSEDEDGVGDIHANLLMAAREGLADGDDDVRAVAAATLIPLADEFDHIWPDDMHTIMANIWDCLADIRDDLSASTGNIMDLLARLCKLRDGLLAMIENASVDKEQSFAVLVPRLYPFLRHTIPSVRLAALGALKTFVAGDNQVDNWISGRIIRLMFQQFLVEQNEDILKASMDIWNGFCLADRAGFSAFFHPHFRDCLTLALHPVGVSRHPMPINPGLIVRPSGATLGPLPAGSTRKEYPQETGEPPKKRRKQLKKEEEPPPTSHNVDGHMLQGDVDLVSMETLIRSRIYAARALGAALANCIKKEGPNVLLQLRPAFTSPHSTTQMAVAMIVEETARNLTIDKAAMMLDSTKQLLHTMIEQERPNSYSDITSYLIIVRAQCHALVNAFRDQAKVPPAKLPTIAAVVQGDPSAGPSAFSIANAEAIVGEKFERLKDSLNSMQRVTSLVMLNEARTSAVNAIEEAKKIKAERDIRIRSAAASAMVALLDIPKKPSLLIKSLMDSVTTEANVELQNRAADSVSALLKHYSIGSRGPADKMLGNLVKFYCLDTSDTPEFTSNVVFQDAILSLRKDEDRREHPDAAKFEEEARVARITRRGAKETFDRINNLFGRNIFISAPLLYRKIDEPLGRAFRLDWPDNIEAEDNPLGQDAIDAMSLLRVLVPRMHEDVHATVERFLNDILAALFCRYAVFRYAAAKCFATICNTMRIDGMQLLVEKVLPAMNNPLELHARQGAIECVYHLLHIMGDEILPYVVFLIVPILGRMSDSDGDVRLIATTTFATLVKLVPLEAGIEDPKGFSKEMLQGRDRERRFIAQMLDPKKTERFDIPVAIKAELRSYQQDGVNWLAFLNRFNLHGVLCDDMGLGKTLQTLCMVASDHHTRAVEFAKTQDVAMRRLSSLIICPPTLSGHWQQEIQTYAPFLSCLAYVGPPSERTRMRHLLGSTDVVITSYDVCRNDIETLQPLQWNYCVLDEGHLIKNPRAKTTIAVKRIASNHRLILSGTPIQNNVLELWSLFDFLMPGFLGTEKIFQERFAKPIAASRYAKSSSKEQERGALAIESLHKQVLPFLLRRLKEEVLEDLPPKILQNYYCDLSELQKKLFEDFAKKESKTLAEKAGSDDKEAKQHIFQALQYMRKLCNSPSLVVKEGHKQYDAIQKHLAKSGSSLRDTAHAPKLTALRDLLLDCGIGRPGSADESQLQETSYVSQHRALIFCQMKEMLDMVQTDVLKQLLPSVQHLRLDGSVEASKRQTIVNQFNSDPSYDVLLLTTSVGGLGLNLTGADTVIFVEHDWNPQKDLQAMDRAHRIGQKKVVNVYRLITRGTLEEKILKYVSPCLFFFKYLHQPY